MKDQIAHKPALATLAVVSWAGVLLQFWLSINLALANGNTVGDGIVVVLGYFTVLTNLFVALTASLPLIASSTALPHSAIVSAVYRLRARSDYSFKRNRNRTD